MVAVGFTSLRLLFTSDTSCYPRVFGDLESVLLIDKILLYPDCDKLHLTIGGRHFAYGVH